MRRIDQASSTTSNPEDLSLEEEQRAASTSGSDSTGMTPGKRAVGGIDSDEETDASAEESETTKSPQELGQQLLAYCKELPFIATESNAVGVRLISEEIRRFLKEGADTSITDDGGYTALMFLVMRNYVQPIECFRHDSEFDINQKDLHGNSALHLACAMKTHGPVSCLLLIGANMNLENGRGQKPGDCFSGLSARESRAYAVLYKRMSVLGEINLYLDKRKHFPDYDHQDNGMIARCLKKMPDISTKKFKSWLKLLKALEGNTYFQQAAWSCASIIGAMRNLGLNDFKSAEKILHEGMVFADRIDQHNSACKLSSVIIRFNLNTAYLDLQCVLGNGVGLAQRLKDISKELFEVHKFCRSKVDSPSKQMGAFASDCLELFIILKNAHDQGLLSPKDLFVLARNIMAAYESYPKINGIIPYGIYTSFYYVAKMLKSDESYDFYGLRCIVWANTVMTRYKAERMNSPNLIAQIEDKYNISGITHQDYCLCLSYSIFYLLEELRRSSKGLCEVDNLANRIGIFLTVSPDHEPFFTQELKKLKCILGKNEILSDGRYRIQIMNCYDFSAQDYERALTSIDKMIRNKDAAERKRRVAVKKETPQKLEPATKDKEAKRRQLRMKKATKEMRVSEIAVKSKAGSTQLKPTEEVAEVAPESLNITERYLRGDKKARQWMQKNAPNWVAMHDQKPVKKRHGSSDDFGPETQSPDLLTPHQRLQAEIRRLMEEPVPVEADQEPQDVTTASIQQRKVIAKPVKKKEGKRLGEDAQMSCTVVTTPTSPLAAKDSALPPVDSRTQPVKPRTQRRKKKRQPAAQNAGRSCTSSGPQHEAPAAETDRRVKEPSVNPEYSAGGGQPRREEPACMAPYSPPSASAPRAALFPLASEGSSAWLPAPATRPDMSCFLEGIQGISFYQESPRDDESMQKPKIRLH